MELIKSPVSWDNIWIECCDVICKKSKDPHTNVAAIIVSPDNREVAIGYNGFAIGIADTKERWQRPTKYSYVIHAEMNAIINAKKDLAGWTLYLTMPPCDNCTKHIIQAGIKRIVYINEPSSNAFNYKLSFEMLSEAEVEISKFEQ